MKEEAKACRLCSSKDLIEMINLGDMPIAHRLLTTLNEKEETFPLALHYCTSCGLGQNCNPINPDVLYKDYNYCFSSWKQQPHMAYEVKTIASRSGKGPVIEIAANDGLFLEELRKNNFPLLAGIEPNLFAGKAAREKGFHIYSEMLNDKVCREATDDFGKFKTIVARQVIEHLTDLQNFFNCADNLTGKNGFLFADIPDINESLLDKGDCSFIWEEHVNYFTQEVFENLLKRFNYSPISTKKYSFSYSTLAILAEKTNSALRQKGISRTLEEKARNFSLKTKNLADLFKNTMAGFKEKGYDVVLYGVGGRACTIVNGLRLGKHIDFIIDDKKERQHRYMPGSRLPILEPSVIYNSRNPVICLLAVSNENELPVKKRLVKNLNKNTKIKFASLLNGNIVSEIENLR